MVCQACLSAELEKPKDGHPSYLICPNCLAIQLTYKPQDYQAAFHADPTKYKMFAGGYGSGKTYTCVNEALLLGLENPGTQAVMTAATLPQLRETSMATFFKEVVPPPLIKTHHEQQNKTVLINGTEYLWRPADDEGKFRSINLGFFHIEEASEVKYEIFVQLTSRLRNNRMKHHRGILSTNPDLGWVKTHFKDVDVPTYSTHIVKTAMNKFLPENYEADLRKGKPEWWVNRYLEGSFEHTEGAVYPHFSRAIIEPFEIPRHWNHYRIGHDHGLRNPTAVLFAAVNPFLFERDRHLPKVVVYDEHYEAGKLVPYHAEVIKQKMSTIPYGALTVMRIDPSTRNRDPITGKSVQAYYQEHGIFYLPGNNSLDYGLAKVNTYINTDSLKIFRTCVNTIREGINYKYPEQKMADDKNPEEKPLSRDDHAMDALRYLIVDLPDNPDHLYNTSYDPNDLYWGNIIHTVTKEGEVIKNLVPYALQTEEYDEYITY